MQKLADVPQERSPGDAAGPTSEEIEGHLSWLPETLAAVALRLYALDANLLYSEDGPPERDLLLVRS